MIPLIDLKYQAQKIKKQVLENISATIDNADFIMGQKVQELETVLATQNAVEHCVSCSSGTDALIMSLMALGIEKGDVVLTTPFTFMATAEAITLCGGTPVFVDVDPNTFNICAKSLEKTLSALKNKHHEFAGFPDVLKQSPDFNVKGIITVDLFGNPCHYDKIESICDKHNLFILRDAAQSYGARYKGKSIAENGDIITTSFFPAKPLGAFGDGGAIFTNNKKLTDDLVSIRVHGQGPNKYSNIRIGVNGRLDTIQAIVLLEKLKLFDAELAARQKLAESYAEMLDGRFQLQEISESDVCSWAQFSLLADNEEHRRLLLNKLSDNKVGHSIYYPTPLHLQPAFEYLGYSVGCFPIAEDLSTRIFSIPMHPYLSLSDAEKATGLLLG